MNLCKVTNELSKVQVLRDGEFEVLGFVISKIEKKTLTFLESADYIDQLKENVSCVICTKEVSESIPEKYGICISESPRRDFFLIHNYLTKNNLYGKAEFKTQIGENVQISNRAIISEKNVIIGDNVVIEENVIIRDDVEIGDNSIIRANTVLGGEGFQYIQGNEIIYVEHAGGLKIGNNVEVKYNNCIDKALFSWDNTVIKNYVKVGCLNVLGHACKIGERTLIAGGAAISGATIIGHDCWIGPNATVSHMIEIGDNTRVGIGSVVMKSIESDKVVVGNPARSMWNK